MMPRPITLALRLGWRQDNIYDDPRAQGDRFGWLDGEDLFLEPDIAHVVVQRLARDQGEEFAITKDTLHRRLRERGFVVSCEQGRLTVRRDVEGARRRVLHLRVGDVIPPQVGQVGQEQPAQAPSSGPDGPLGPPVVDGHTQPRDANTPFSGDQATVDGGAPPRREPVR
jgi:hypothetical protein